MPNVRQLIILSLVLLQTVARLEVVVHLNSLPACRSAVNIARQLEKFNDVRLSVWSAQLLWEHDENPLLQQIKIRRKAYKSEDSSIVARFAESVDDLSKEEEEEATVLIVDLDKWRACRGFGASFPRILPRLAKSTGLAVLALENSTPGAPRLAASSVLILRWKARAWAKRYASALRSLITREAQRAPLNWAPSLDSRVAFVEATITLSERYYYQVRVAAMPKNLICITKCTTECLGALRVSGPSAIKQREERNARQLAINATALLASQIHDSRTRNIQCLNISEDDTKKRKKTHAQTSKKYKKQSGSILVVTGVNSRPPGPNRDADIDLALNKMWYAEYQNHNFVFYVADSFRETIGNLPWEFSKIFMIQDALLSFTCDWVVWIDADAWINPAFFDYSLNEWLHDIPKDRAIVLTNFKGFNTGILAIRSSLTGRRLLQEWLAISRARLAQCHPHDQAALQLLQLWYLNGSNPELRSPYNYDCVKREGKCGLKIDGSPNNFWSCIPLWHHCLAHAHSTYSPRFQINSPETPRNQRVDPGSVVDRGLANRQIAPFYIVTENKYRPRLQCFRCLDDLHTLSRYPGNNAPTLDPTSMDGWLINHKGQSFYYQTAFKSQSSDRKALCFVSAATVRHFKG